LNVFAGIVFSMPNTPKIYGFELRSPYQGELQYFQKNPHVAGMATEDNRIILNPASGLSEREKMAVAQNEALRLFMKQKNFQPDFDLTDEQMKFFQGMKADYAKPENKMAARHTILARIMSGDPSAGKASEAQMMAVQKLKAMLPK
jgi:hypothetical protein